LGPSTWSYSFNESLLYSVADKLGWPWSPTKCFPFSFSFTYIGFQWDLRLRTVQLPEKKKIKYLNRLTSWSEESKHSKSEIETLIGTLNHVCLVVPSGRAYLPSLYRYRASFGNSSSPFLLRKITACVLDSVRWWRHQLSLPFLGIHISLPPELSSHKLYVDASTSWGIGLVLDGKWLAWEYKEGWNDDKRGIGWGEMAAVNLAVATLVSSGLKNISIICHTDNQGVHGALKAGRSRGPTQNEVLRKIVHLMQDHNIWVTTKWIRSEDNPADGPSRGIFPLKRLIHGHPPKVPSHLKAFINNHVVHSDPRIHS
jgi:hypothetical protein